MNPLPSYHGRDEQSLSDAVALGLTALAWILADGERASRLLALTGLDPAALRTRVSDPALLAAAIGFLEAREADLVACADALGVAPDALVRTGRTLER